MTALPIEPLLPALLASLRQHGRLVLQAPPGAGKTTRVPLALAAAQPWGQGKILVLEPRRLAAKLAARQMARSLGEAVGETVGYRVRLDSCVGPRTRIELLTDGLFLRLLQEDPALTGVTAVLFDEVHERGVGSDLALALTWQAKQLLVPDLALLAMSATLDAEPLAQLLGGAPVLSSSGQAYPVQTFYADRSAPDQPTVAAIADQVRPAIRRALAEQRGSVLVFLPGQAEIRRLGEQLQDLPEEVELTPLYGDLDGRAQDAAVAPAAAGRRKLVLATALAESSLTIEGISVVVDAGWSRVSRFDPATGLARLLTEKASLAQADQRRGRAGRLGPGVCYRLWTAIDQQRRPAQPQPEILGCDPAPLALELALWGAGSGEGLAFLDPPPAVPLEQARQLLTELGGLDAQGQPTKRGRALGQLGLHPRLGAMLLAAGELQLPAELGLPAWGAPERQALACALAALLGERDPLRQGAVSLGADLCLRLDRLERGRGDGWPLLRQLTQQLRRQLRLPRDLPLLPEGWPAWVGVLLALAYPDRLGLPRAAERPGVFLLASGRGAALGSNDPLAASAALVAAHLDGDRRQARIWLAAALPLAALELLQADQLRSRDLVQWDDNKQLVQARRQRCLGALLLNDEPLANPDPELLRACVLEQLRRGGLQQLAWTPERQQLRGRLGFLQRLEPELWPAVDDTSLLAELELWLGPALGGVRSLGELQRLDVGAALLDRLDWRQRSQLDVLAPLRWPLPTGRVGRIDYTGEEPVLSSRLQDFFGLTATPRLAEGRHAVLVHLLSPAGRPAAVTRDLASFWQQGYPLVRKDLRGRYPKHRWPEDPLAPA